MCPHIEVKPLDILSRVLPQVKASFASISSTGQHVSDWQTDRHTDKHTSYLTVAIGAQTLTTNQPCNSRYLVGRTLLQRRQPDETYQYMLYMLSLCYAIYIAIHNYALLRKLISCFICVAMYTCHRTYFISDIRLSLPNWLINNISVNW